MSFLESIEKNIRNNFGLKQEELEKIKLLLLFSFFLGIFVAFYFVPANSEFVNYYGSAQLPYAYILSGIAGALTLMFYSWVQRHTQSKLLFLSAILIMLIISLLPRLAVWFIEHYNFADPKIKKTAIRYVSFFVFIWAWPFIALTATITGGLAIRLFNLLEVKKFYGIVNLGGVLAAIISYFTISLILKYIGHHYNLILIGSLGLIAAIFLLNYIYKKFPDSSETAKIHKTRTLGSVIRNFPNKRFIIWIFIGAAFSIIAIYIADYGFLITIKQQKAIFPDRESVAKFMSIVFGLLKVGEFIISILSGRLLTRYGLKFGLVCLAATITVFEILAIGAAFTIGVNSIVFLAIMTGNKMFERIIRRGIDDPSFNVLYQTLPEDLKLFIQTRVGGVQQISIALAGVILLIIHKLLSVNNHFRLELYPVYTLPFLFVWIFVTFRLYSAYKYRIKQILADKKLFILEYVEKDTFALDILQKYLLTDKVNVAKFSVVVLSETNPRALEPFANFLLKIDDTIIRKAILNNIDSTYSERLIETIERIGNEIGFKEKELRRLILRALYQLDYSEVGEYTYQELKQLIESPNIRDKILAAKYLYKNHVENDHLLIEKLLECEDKSVRLAAIKIASKRPNNTLKQKLIQLLQHPQYSNFLINILIELGETVIQDLDQQFDSYEPNLQLKIIQIYAKIGTPSAQQKLLKHINFPDRTIQQAVIDALFYSDYQATDEEQIELIRQKIYQTVDNILWFYATIKDIAREKNTLKLIQSLDLELEKTTETLFTLLTFLHSKQTIDLIKSNIIGENTIFAIELIDNFIRPDIKRLIIPIFEKTPLGVKIKKLRRYFRHQQLGFEKRLQHIILQDYQKIDLWSKVKAIELVGKIARQKWINQKINLNINFQSDGIWRFDPAFQQFQKINCEPNLAALIIALWHHEEIIFTTAAKMLINIEPNLLNDIIPKLPEYQRKTINSVVQNDDFLIDRIKLLKRIYLFYTIPEKSLIELAKLIKTEKFAQGQKIPLEQDQDRQKIFIIIKGKLKYKNQEYSRNDVIIKGLNLAQEAQELSVEKNANLLIVNRFEFFNLLAMDKDLVGHLFNRMKF